MATAIDKYYVTNTLHTCLVGHITSGYEPLVLLCVTASKAFIFGT